MIIITKLENIYKEKDNKIVCLIYWKKLILLLNLILKILSLLSLNEAIIDCLRWNNIAIK